MCLRAYATGDVSTLFPRYGRGVLLQYPPGLIPTSCIAAESYRTAIVRPKGGQNNTGPTHNQEHGGGRNPIVFVYSQQRLIIRSNKIYSFFNDNLQPSSPKLLPETSIYTTYTLHTNESNAHRFSQLIDDIWRLSEHKIQTHSFNRRGDIYPAKKIDLG